MPSHRGLQQVRKIAAPQSDSGARQGPVGAESWTPAGRRRQRCQIKLNLKCTWWRCSSWLSFPRDDPPLGIQAIA
jgi:hypothetical protein